jgi:hypothetical protein
MYAYRGDFEKLYNKLLTLAISGTREDKGRT